MARKIESAAYRRSRTLGLLHPRVGSIVRLLVCPARKRAPLGSLSARPRVPSPTPLCILSPIVGDHVGRLRLCAKEERAAQVPPSPPIASCPCGFGLGLGGRRARGSRWRTRRRRGGLGVYVWNRVSVDVLRVPQHRVPVNVPRLPRTARSTSRTLAPSFSKFASPSTVWRKTSGHCPSPASSPAAGGRKSSCGCGSAHSAGTDALRATVS
jgi:hypothetical protein